MDVTIQRLAALGIVRRTLQKRIAGSGMPTAPRTATDELDQRTLDGLFATAFESVDNWQRSTQFGVDNETNHIDVRQLLSPPLLWTAAPMAALATANRLGNGTGVDSLAPSAIGGGFGGDLGDHHPAGTYPFTMYPDTDANDTELPDFGLFYRHSLTLTAVYCVAYIFVFIVGLVGNSFVIAVVVRSPRMRTVTNFFIVNLAVADILVIVFCLPATLMSNIFVPWMLGWLMCKTVPYIQGVSVAASVYSLCAVSVDRFLAIWWPLKLQICKRRARLMILAIWLIACGTTVPWALFFKLVPLFPEAPDIELCMEVWPEGMNGSYYFLFANLFACYLLPMVLITLCYVLIWIKVWRRSIPGDSKDAQMDRMQQKSKIKVVKMLIAVVILFVLSWLPLYYIFARIKLGNGLDENEEELLQVATPIAQWLGSSNSCINPILYAFFNKKFRRGFAAIIRSRSCWGRLRYYDNVLIASSTTSTRKSSHNHNRNSNGATNRQAHTASMKSDAVSYIYDHNSNRAKQIQQQRMGEDVPDSPSCNQPPSAIIGDAPRGHKTVAKQDSDMSTQMLLKQDSTTSRQYLFKQDSANSRQMLLKQESSDCSSITECSVSRQDSNASLMGPSSPAMSAMAVATAAARSAAQLRHQDSAGSKHALLSKQDSVVSYIETKRGQLMRQDSDLASRRRAAEAAGMAGGQDSGPQQLHKQDTQISFVEGIGCSAASVGRQAALCRQDSVVSFAEPREMHRGPLVKQESVISFADQRRGFFGKQESVIVQSYRVPGATDGPHVSILKKTDSLGSSSCSPVRKTIEFAE